MNNLNRILSQTTIRKMINALPKNTRILEKYSLFIYTLINWNVSKKEKKISKISTIDWSVLSQNEEAMRILEGNLWKKKPINIDWDGDLLKKHEQAMQILEGNLWKKSL